MNTEQLMALFRRSSVSLDGALLHRPFLAPLPPLFLPPLHGANDQDFAPDKLRDTDKAAVRDQRFYQLVRTYMFTLTPVYTPPPPHPPLP